MAKKFLDFALVPSFEDFLDYELMVQPQLNQSADYREGFTSFQEKRPARFTGRQRRAAQPTMPRRDTTT
ncbi:hypothetical protein AYJ54_17910 [Bradyrhizobium centrolobii]|uniref:Uncharacterized protein n=1 Tax=Bradyrhizobium centrolobii TaxID=1505087 RepID=A0A176YM24_9BRAD|nr:hypothetical protein [Bradyrhizobium centrolobii]OAF07203.1 hypothetical protein AYJ54_17910 [Bradyrhizobium centrolobii]